MSTQQSLASKFLLQSERRDPSIPLQRPKIVRIRVSTLLGCAAFLVSFPTLVQARSADEKVRRLQAELEAISRARFQALVARDVSALKKYYSPDFQAVGGDGEPVGVGFLERIMRAAPKDFAMEPFAFRFLISADGSQGVVFHKSHDLWDGQKSDVAYTEVYARREGHWQLCFEQYAELQLPASAPVKAP